MNKEEKQKILIVDDTAENIQILMGLLKSDYKIIAAKSGEKALKMAQADPIPDLILLDIMMPEMDGYEVCKRLKLDEKTTHIPVIFVTAMTEREDEYRGLSIGAVDYITKPFIPNMIKARVKSQMELQRYRADLENMVAERTKKLERTQSVMIDSLGTLAEYRDPETGGHIKRTQNYMKVLAKKLQSNPKYAEELTDDAIEMLYLSAPLHDIGKVGIPDSILLKNGKLEEDEFNKMKKHTDYGYETLKKTEIQLGGDSFIKYAIDIAYTHHEKWNGFGYPKGLKGEEIPLAGRLMAVADVYDALISKRVYKAPFSHEKAMGIIKQDRGTHFDPDVVDAFLELEATFRNIAIIYADFEEERETLKAGRNIVIENILLVEDHEINLDIMKSQVEALGYMVTTAVNGLEAYKLLTQKTFDLVLTDLEMPIMDGYELVNTMRKAGILVPVIAVTGSDYNINDSNAQDMGFNGFLLKPFDENNLKIVLSKMM